LERQKTVIFYADKCLDCGACIDACKYHAISRAA
jgi:NAD-dependent dihydropyrimidine dehydrogenase PreA subunit